MHVDTGTGLDLLSHFSLQTRAFWELWALSNKAVNRILLLLFFLIKSIHKKEIKKPKQTKTEEYGPRTNPKTRLLSACLMEISKLTVTNTLTHKNSGFTPEPSNIFFFLVYNTLLSVQAGPTVLICPEWLSKPVLRILSNVLKFLKYQPQEAIKQLL